MVKNCCVFPSRLSNKFYIDSSHQLGVYCCTKSKWPLEFYKLRNSPKKQLLIEDAFYFVSSFSSGVWIAYAVVSMKFWFSMKTAITNCCATDSIWCVDRDGVLSEQHKVLITNVDCYRFRHIALFCFVFVAGDI